MPEFSFNRLPFLLFSLYIWQWAARQASLGGIKRWASGGAVPERTAGFRRGSQEYHENRWPRIAHNSKQSSHRKAAFRFKPAIHSRLVNDL